MPTPSRRTLSTLAACIVAMALLGAGCGDDDDPPPPSTGPTTTDPTTTLSPEQEDEQALRRLANEWFEVVRRILAGDTEADLAREFLSGGYLSKFEEQLADLERTGQSVRPDPDNRSSNETRSVVINGNNAELVECIVDGDHLVASDGRVLNDDVTARLVRTDATRTEAGWRFVDRVGLSEQRGSEACAEA